jgi:hypothetical protein
MTTGAERDMNVRELLAVLDQLRQLYAATGAKTADKNIAKVIELLAPHDGKPVEILMADMRSAAESAQAKSAAKAAITSAPALTAADELIIDQYVRRLTEAGTDPGGFDETFVALTEDTGVKLKEADAIARKYTRHHAPFKTKKAALTAIKQAFVERARFENKLRAVG